MTRPARRRRRRYTLEITAGEAGLDVAFTDEEGTPFVSAGDATGTLTVLDLIGQCTPLIAASFDRDDESAGCLPDSSGADWFECSRGTVGCPRIHDGVTPHCIACAAGEPCDHDPPALAQTEAEYQAQRAARSA